MTVLGKTVQHRFFLQKLSPVILRILKSFFIKNLLKNLLKTSSVNESRSDVAVFQALELEV